MRYCTVYYQRYLTWALGNKKMILLVWTFISITSIVLFFILPHELFPTENQGFLIVTGEASTNANQHYLNHYAAYVQNILQKQFPDSSTVTFISNDAGYTSYLVFKNKNISTKATAYELQKQLTKIPGLDLHVIMPRVSAGNGPVLQFVIKSYEDYAFLYQAVKNIENRAMRSGLFTYLYDDLNYSNSQATIEIDKNAAAATNVSMKNIAETLSILMNHNKIQQYHANEQTRDIILSPMQKYQLTPEELQNFSVKTFNNKMVPLSAVTSIKYDTVPVSLNQFQKINSVTIMGGMRPSASMSQALDLLATITKKNYPTKVSIDYADSSRQFIQENQHLIWIFSLALVLIFLILSIQFESYRIALIILGGSFPMAIFSALFPMEFFSLSLNIYSQIGLLTLLGLICKHGILMTRFANDLIITNKLLPQAAIIKAATIRFRPILMTATAILLGVLPLCYSTGAGCESRQSIGIIIAFGISLGTVLTLLVFPVIYSIFTKK